MSVQDYSTTPSSNTTIAGINVGEGCPPANINNAIRQLMADLAVWAATLEVGTDIQAYSAKLKALADLTWAANKLIYPTGANTVSTTDLTAKARELLGKTDEAAMRTLLGLKALALKDKAAVGDIDVTGTPGADSVLFGDRWAGILGYGQAAQNVTASRVANTAYQNTTGRPILVAISAQNSPARDIQVSLDGTSWVTVGRLGNEIQTTLVLVFPGSYYRISNTATIQIWAEYR